MSQTPPALAAQAGEAMNPVLQGRVQMAMCKAAQDISSESAATPGHAARVQLANQVARSPQMMTQPFTSMVCAQGITSVSADADISNMVSAVWDVMAGASPV